MNALLLSVLFIAPMTSQSTVQNTTHDNAKQVRAAKTPTLIKFEVAPKATMIYVDGRKKGKAGKVHKVRVKPGKHDVRLVFNRDETEFEIKIQKGKILVIKYAFEDSGRPTPKIPEPKAKPKPKKESPRAQPDRRDENPDKSRDDDEPYDDFDSDIPR